jgi:hypothetical protein
MFVLDVLLDKCACFLNEFILPNERKSTFLIVFFFYFFISKAVIFLCKKICPQSTKGNLKSEKKEIFEISYIYFINFNISLTQLISINSIINLKHNNNNNNNNYSLILAYSNY